MEELVRFTEAAALAARAHARQHRKGKDGIPYINHPLEVAALVADAGGTAPEVTAAVLHDVVEDSDITLDEIAAEFGDEVARLVDALTDDAASKGLPRPERKRRQAEHLPDAPEGARRIKIADQTSNLRDIVRATEGWAPGEAAEYIEGAELVVAACRGVSTRLEAAFDAAAAEAMQKIGGAG